MNIFTRIEARRIRNRALHRIRAIGVGLLLVSLAACAEHKPLPSDPAALKVEMNGLIPEGTTLAAAKAALEKRGFEVRIETNAAPGKPSYLFGTAHQALSSPVQRDWLVRFEVKAGRVYDLFVRTDLTGP